jgi:hypothetical protein
VLSKPDRCVFLGILSTDAMPVRVIGDENSLSRASMALIFNNAAFLAQVIYAISCSYSALFHFRALLGF